MPPRPSEGPRSRPRKLLVVATLATLASLVALAVVTGSHRASAASRSCSHLGSQWIHDSFPEPQFRYSHNGLLKTDLVASMTRTKINGKTYRSTVYDGLYPGPTMVLCPGDIFKLRFHNHLKKSSFPGFGPMRAMSNIHTHGFFVTPRPPQDDIFLEIHPGQHYNYRYVLPSDERPGAYWYHPHMHTQANVQEMGGMLGAIIMRGGLDFRPSYRNIGERLLVIHQTATAKGKVVQPGPHGPFLPQGTKLYVNGHLNPKIPIHPGEIQRWIIENLNANSFVKLQLQGHNFQLLARDGNYVPRRITYKTLLISPASRREVLVRGGPSGSAKLIAAPFGQFGPGTKTPPQTLATMVSRGRTVHDRMPPAHVFAFPDLRKFKVRQRHRIVYTQKPPNFLINGKKFNPHRTDQFMTRGQLNEWTLVNKTPFFHTFHIHINDFQVISVNGKKVHGIDQEDNVTMPPMSTVKMLTLPLRYTGRFVFHCHILGHEDNGMMGTVAVVDPAGGRGLGGLG